MSAVTVTAAEMAPAEARLVPAGRRHGMGIFLVLLAVIMFWAFGVSVDGKVHSTFILTQSPAVNVSPPRKKLPLPAMEPMFMPVVERSLMSRRPLPLAVTLAVPPSDWF